MKIKILNLFHNYLNLYGEQANIKAITYYLNNQGIEVSVINHHLNEDIDLTDIDLVVAGQGIETNLDEVIKQLDKNKFQKYLESGGFVFFSGNASKILGSQGLALLPYDTEDNKTRIVFEGLYESSVVEHECICFINSYTTIIKNNNYLFKLNKTNTPDINYLYDGYHTSNIYITSLIGPVLVRNPWLNEKILKELIKTKDPDFCFRDMDYSLEENALNEFKKLYYSEKLKN